MQILEQEFENLITEVVKKRRELIHAGLMNCGYEEEWLKDPENKKRYKFIDAEDVVNGGHKTQFYLDDELIFEVVCTVDHKSMTINSELKMIKENKSENNI